MICLQFANPTPASRIRHQGARHWHDEPYAGWLRYARDLCALRGPREPLQGPICLAVVVIAARPERRPLWAPAANWREGCRLWRPVRPDDDNYGKAIRDAMNGRVFADDGQIVASLAYKVVAARGEDARILAQCGTIGEQPEVSARCMADLGRVL